MNYYFDSKDTWEQRIAKASVSYYRRYGEDAPKPDQCHVHPDTKTEKIKGIKFVSDQYIQKNHLWLGKKEN